MRSESLNNTADEVLMFSRLNEKCEKKPIKGKLQQKLNDDYLGEDFVDYFNKYHKLGW